MIVLVTEGHVNALQTTESAASPLLESIARSADEDFATTAITREEQMRGWL